MKRRAWITILAAVAILLLIQGELWADPIIKEIYYQKKTTLSYPKTRTFRFSLWLTDTGGTDPIWSEEKQVKMTNAYVKTYLGDATLFDTVPVDFSQQYWVQVDQWKPKTNTWVPVGLRDPLGVVPYALYSESSSGGGGGGITGVTAGAGLTGGGTTGNVTLDVGAGTGITVGANDISVNFAGSGLASTVSRSDHDHDATYVNQTGDTMSGTLTVSTTGSNLAVVGTTTGTMNAGQFTINNGSSGGAAINGTTNGTGPGVSGNSTGTGFAGYFNINNASSTGTALFGTTNGSGPAVSGRTTGTGLAGRFEINNASNSVAAIYGITNGTGPGISAHTTGTGFAGRFEIDNANNSVAAIYGITNGNGTGGRFEINNASNSVAALYSTTNGSGPAINGTTTGTGLAGYFGGNVTITGNLTKGSGSFVQPHPKEPTKELVYAFFEGPEHAIFLRGTTKLMAGKAVIETPEYF